jgi:hypothetical protein
VRYDAPRFETVPLTDHLPVQRSPRIRLAQKRRSSPHHLALCPVREADQGMESKHIREPIIETVRIYIGETDQDQVNG